MVAYFASAIRRRHKKTLRRQGFTFLTRLGYPSLSLMEGSCTLYRRVSLYARSVQDITVEIVHETSRKYN